MSKDSIGNYNLNEYLEILTYLYEMPNVLKPNIYYSNNFNKKYKSIFKKNKFFSVLPIKSRGVIKIDKGFYAYEYRYFGITLNKYQREIKNLILNQIFDKVLEKKIELFLYKKISYLKFQTRNFGTSKTLKEMTTREFEALPDKIVDVSELPDTKKHKEFLEYAFTADHKYRKVRQDWIPNKEPFGSFKNIEDYKEYYGAIWKKSELKTYISQYEKNNTLYDQYVKNFNLRKAIFNVDKKKDNDKLNNILDSYTKGKEKGIFDYLKLIVSLSLYNSKAHPTDFEFQYNKEEKILIVNCQLPDFERIQIFNVPSKIGSIPKKVSKAEHKKITENSLYIIPIRIIYEFFYFDNKKYFNHIALNGIIQSYNKATGNLEKNNVLSLFVKREEVLKLNLLKVDPKECFKALKGVSASKIYDNVAIKPILTFKKDSRIIESKDVLDNLEEENLAVMEWDEFEHLIRELFAKEFSQDGAEVKITQASRDRGVDAIAYDPDPIRGGKFVIQAKRYTATVDVSAVRDLYGTILNEGANRGILVTTAKYGADAFNFAKDKNITLLEGNELLGLLKKHGYNFKIDIREARKILNLTTKKTY